MQTFVVATVGKVGTTAIQAALRQLPEVKVYKTHLIDVRALNRLIKRRAKENGSAPRWAVESRDFIRQGGLENPKTVLITPVREIVGRNISGFFQRHKEFGLKPPFDQLDVQATIDTFKREFPHNRPDHWFRKPFAERLGFKFEKIPFDPDRGFTRTSLNGHEMLLFQIELGSTRITQLLNAEFGITPAIRRVNDSSQKDYGELMKRFKECFILDDEFAEMMMALPYMQKFYSEPQRQHIKAFYQGKVKSLLPLPRRDDTQGVA